MYTVDATDAVLADVHTFYTVDAADAILAEWRLNVSSLHTSLVGCSTALQ